MEIDSLTDSFVSGKVNVSGVSQLSTSEISAFVSSKIGADSDLSIKVEWIDDNTCNLIFPSDDLVSTLLSLAELSPEGVLFLSCDTSQLSLRRALVSDSKPSSHSWKDSDYYKKKLEQKGINPTTLKPVGKVILKPAPNSKPTKVTLVSRKLVQEAKKAIYGDDAFSKKKLRNDLFDETEMARRAERFAKYS